MPKPSVTVVTQHPTYHASFMVVVNNKRLVATADYTLPYGCLDVS